MHTHAYTYIHDPYTRSCTNVFTKTRYTRTHARTHTHTHTHTHTDAQHHALSQCLCRSCARTLHTVGAIACDIFFLRTLSHFPRALALRSLSVEPSHPRARHVFPLHALTFCHCAGRNDVFKFHLFRKRVLLRPAARDIYIYLSIYTYIHTGICKYISIDISIYVNILIYVEKRVLLRPAARDILYVSVHLHIHPFIHMPLYSYASLCGQMGVSAHRHYVVEWV